jgi:hypothetical protein
VAVLIEANSVVVRADRLLAALENDWEGFKRTVPNKTQCADGELVRVGFMVPDDAYAYIRHLESLGCRYNTNGNVTDIAFIEQARGLLGQCDWAEYGHINLGQHKNQRVAACRLLGSKIGTITLPDGWEFEKSLSGSYGCVLNENMDKSLTFLRRDDGLDLYWNALSCAEVYIGRVREPV